MKQTLYHGHYSLSVGDFFPATKGRHKFAVKLDLLKYRKTENSV